MRIQYIKSACVVIEYNGTRVLCDPWLTDGGYYGSWYHYPQLTYEPEDFTNVNYLYISHVHPDHLDFATLKSLPKTIPVLIHDYHEKFLLNILKRIGFTHVREVAHRESITLAPKFTIEILAADNCNPSLCGKQFGCIPTSYGHTLSIDSLAVFQANGQVLVNANDCPYPLSRGVCDYVLERHGSVDMALVGYSGAGPYPQCFDNLDDDEKQLKADVKRRQFIYMAAEYLRHLRPRFFLPFAGQYTLGGKLTVLNPYRGVPEIEELPMIGDYWQNKLSIGSEMVLLNPGATFDLESGTTSESFLPPDPNARQQYIDNVLRHKKFAYETNTIESSNQAELMPKLTEAQKHMLQFQNKYGGYRSKWKIYIDVGWDHFYFVPMNGMPVSKVQPTKVLEPFIRISLDYSLLDMILNRKAHWNNAEIGSHLRFFRQPDLYERPIFNFLSFLHC